MRSIIRNIYNSLPSCSIIMVHHVCDNEPLVPSCTISVSSFREYIVGKNIVSINAILKRIIPGAYVLTFDDSLDDLYTIVFPYMKEHGLPFTAFVSAELINKPGYITEKQLVEMADCPLVTIGSHGCTHRHLSKLSDEDSRREITESKRILEILTHKDVDLIAYPFGDAGKREITYAKEAGYRYGLGVTPRKSNFLTKILSRMKMPRYNLTNECSNPA